MMDGSDDDADVFAGVQVDAMGDIAAFFLQKYHDAVLGVLAVEVGMCVVCPFVVRHDLDSFGGNCNGKFLAFSGCREKVEDFFR